MAESSQERPMIVASLPEETAHAARAVFNIENVYLAIGDQLTVLLDGISLSKLDIRQAFHPSTSIQLALLTIFQFAEELADRAVCAALTHRMDWKYALHLPIEYRRLEPALLCQFRQPLIGNQEGLETLKSLLDRLAAVGLLARDKRSIPAAGILDHICRLNQIDRLHEDVSQAIEVLASHKPDMLRAVAQPYWYDRYRQGREFHPVSMAEHQAYAQALGADACHVLQAVAAASDSTISELPEVRRLSSVWNKLCQVQGTTITWKVASCELCPWLAEGSPRGCGGPPWQ